MAFNDALAEEVPQDCSNADVTEWIRKAVEANFTVKETTRRRFELRPETDTLIDSKRTLAQQGASELELQDIKTKVVKAIRKDKRRHTLEMIDKEVDVRDQFMGLRCLRRPFAPIPLSMKDATGKHIPFHERAQKAAEYLGSVIWNSSTNTDTTSRGNVTPKDRIITEDLNMNTGNITMEEVEWAVKKLKRGKAAGPDGIPMDCYKELQEISIKTLLNMFNHWWHGGTISDDVTQALVILLYTRRQIKPVKLQTNITSQLKLQNLHSHSTKKTIRRTRQTSTENTIRL